MNLFGKIFILTGHRKSGTSVFHKLFDGHQDLFIYPTDISILYAYFPFFIQELKQDSKALRNRLKTVIIKSLSSVNKNTDRIKNFSIEDFSIEVLSNLGDSDLTQKEKVISTIANCWIEMYYQSNEIKPFLFKETSQSIYLKDFLSFKVPVKMISVIRDPRDNYAAIKAGVKGYYSKMNESELESLASVLNRARIDLLSANHHNNVNQEYFKPVRFEDVVTKTEKTMKEIANFLGIPFSPILLEPTELGMRYDGNNHDGVKFNGLSSKNIGNWKNRISEDEVKIIEYWMNDVMALWSYKNEFSLLDSEKAFSEFYNWYNIRYFYRDSFA